MQLVEFTVSEPASPIIRAKGNWNEPAWRKKDKKKKSKKKKSSTPVSSSSTSSKSQLSDSEDENKFFRLKCLRLYSRKTKTSGIMLEPMHPLSAFWMNLKGIGVTPEKTVFVPVDEFSTSVKRTFMMLTQASDLISCQKKIQ